MSKSLFHFLVISEDLPTERTIKYLFLIFFLIFFYLLQVYITGLGDYEVKNIDIIDDPCPPLNKEDKELLKIQDSDEEKND